ncbi:MAG: PAS domain-containing sensor histidine kinase [Woeseiaceae bacterium]
MATVVKQNLQLVEAFEAFNTHSQKLDVAYEQLRGETIRLTTALNKAKSDRMSELIEKERLASRLAEIIECLPAIVLITSQDGMITDCNGKAINAFGGQLVGRAWSEVCDNNVATTGLSCTEVTLGDERLFSLSQQVFPDGARLIMLTDISEISHRRDTEQRHQRLSLMGEMSARLAHQIRTPLSAAMLYASQSKTSPETHAAVLNSLKSMSAMVDDMLRFAMGTPAPQERLSTASLLRDVVDHHTDLQSPESELTFSWASDNFSIKANRSALMGALNNLVTNAIQHSPDQGMIHLSDRIDESGRVWLSVRDQGCGVPIELRQQIFEPFYTTRSSGTGLGLAVVRSVAEDHDGGVGVDSSAMGSVFSMFLPCEDSVSRFPLVGDQSQFAISETVSPAKSWHKECAHG